MYQINEMGIDCEILLYEEQYICDTIASLIFTLLQHFLTNNKFVKKSEPTSKF